MTLPETTRLCVEAIDRQSKVKPLNLCADVGALKAGAMALSYSQNLTMDFSWSCLSVPRDT